MPGDPAVRERADRGRQPPNGLTDLHLDASSGSSLAHAERWAAEIGVPSYALDEQTALAVVDGSVEVVSEGRWRHVEA